ncbi:MAG: hypothetical protein NC416_12220 [Eubacterium sp.]|nr:hypothetical protein [Eubacterium sp.]
MSTVKVRTGKKHTIKVITSSDQRSVISVQDAVMDARAVQAVKSAVAKAEFCKKPIAKYDIAAKKAYIEYADGARKYVR